MADLNLKQCSDEELIEQCLRRLENPGASEQAWEELILRFGAVIRRQISLLTWDGNLDQKDLYQIVCTRLHETALRQFDQRRGTFAQYLSRVTKNVVLDEWKKVQRSVKRQLPFNEQIRAMAIDTSDLDETLLRAAIQEALRQSVHDADDFNLMNAIVHGEPKASVLQMHNVSEPTYYRRLSDLRSILGPVLGPKRKNRPDEKKAGSSS
ncbi:MAG TPA: sigma factor [Bryobacteraceae bacterium]|jgi:DNA-directed RNA polymerase specialized sigma24 family protein